MAEKVSFKRADGSVVRFAAKTAKKSRGKKATRKAAAPKAAKAAKRRTPKASTRATKSCGCAGTTTSRKHADLALTRVENLKGLVVQNVQTLRRDVSTLKERVARAEGRINDHEQALTQIAERAKGMFAPSAPAASRSGFGAGSPEPGRPRPAAPPMIPRGAGVPNRQMTLGLN